MKNEKNLKNGLSMGFLRYKKISTDVLFIMVMGDILSSFTTAYLAL